MKYLIVYYLPNQSRIFSDPRCVGFDSKDELDESLAIAQKHGYDVIGVYEELDGNYINP